ncbi:MAG: 50S ribosomal protein L18 [FCB group bacterium]|nr:50S ribosomal protein L18 [FCB group bacterium]
MAHKNKRENWTEKKRRLKGHLAIGKYPRLVVFRSNKNISAQIIDDTVGSTLTAASSADKNLQAKIDKAKGKIEKSAIVGESLGAAAVSKGLSKVIFDRNGYRYHGRVKALAEGARKAGLQF